MKKILFILLIIVLVSLVAFLLLNQVLQKNSLLEKTTPTPGHKSSTVTLNLRIDPEKISPKFNLLLDYPESATLELSADKTTVTIKNSKATLILHSVSDDGLAAYPEKRSVIEKFKNTFLGYIVYKILSPDGYSYIDDYREGEKECGTYYDPLTKQFKSEADCGFSHLTFYEQGNSTNKGIISAVCNTENEEDSELCDGIIQGLQGNVIH
jgi:hypothetical protein